MHALHTEIIKPKIGPNIMPNTVKKLLKINRKLHKKFSFFKIIMRNLAWGLNQCAMKARKRKQKLHMTANNCSICIAPKSLFIYFFVRQNTFWCGKHADDDDHHHVAHTTQWAIKIYLTYNVYFIKEFPLFYIL